MIKKAKKLAAAKKKEAELEKAKKKMQASKTKIANQIDAKITTAPFGIREKLSQPAALKLPSVATDVVNAKVIALEAIQRQVRLVVTDVVKNELPDESVASVAKMIVDAKKATNTLVNMMAQLARIEGK